MHVIDITLINHTSGDDPPESKGFLLRASYGQSVILPPERVSLGYLDDIATALYYRSRAKTKRIASGLKREVIQKWGGAVITRRLPIRKHLSSKTSGVVLNRNIPPSKMR